MPYLNKYPLGTTMRPRLAIELTDEQIFWAGLKNFHSDFLSDFTIIYGENYAFLSLFTKALRTDGPTDGPTDQPTDGQTDRPTDGHTLL